MNNEQLISALYRSIGEECVRDPETAHIEIHGNRVLGVHQVPGLEVDAEERKEGIRADITVRENTRIDKPVRVCFGLLEKTGKQEIEMKIHLEEGARAAFLSSCTFPSAMDILHAMDADIKVEKGADYLYLERHVHGPKGGVTIIPKARVQLAEEAKFHADFELVKGRVGKIEMDYEAECGKNSVIQMATRISGRGDDKIGIYEKAHLAGEGAHGVLRTNIAVRERAHAEIKNTLVASAPLARGHVDCREIVQDEAVANAIPVVKVHHPKAHVTHEASIGSVDAKQLETLMSRGLTEDEATDLVIEGLLRPRGR